MLISATETKRPSGQATLGQILCSLIATNSGTHITCLNLTLFSRYVLFPGSWTQDDTAPFYTDLFFAQRVLAASLRQVLLLQLPKSPGQSVSSKERWYNYF